MKNKTISVLVFSGYYLPGFKGGGPIKTVKNLFDQTGESVSYRLITSDRDLGDSVPYSSVVCGAWNEVGNAEVFYAQSGALGYKQIARILMEKKYDIVYLNSFFSPRFSLFPMLIAKMLKQKVIVGPRGEFSEGALSLKAQKKRSFINLYKTLRLHQGTVFQASSKHEADDIRKVLGHKVDIQIAEDIGSQEFAEVLSIRDSSTLRAVFISRISPKKNLLTALEILKDVTQPVIYHIYGPIEDNEYWANCEAVIRTLPDNIQVGYQGELYPNQVINTLSKYDAFFMPTKGENYGHVIAEALCAGLPIIIADTTPWRNLQEKGIGWDLSLDNMAAFSDVIEQLTTMSIDDHHQMRKHVLAWAKNKFSQRDAIDANITMFKYAANK